MADFCRVCGSPVKPYGLFAELGFDICNGFCSHSCEIIWFVLRKNRIGNLGRLYLKDECEVCDCKGDLQAHHKDGNFLNNAPANIETLCGWCHRFWHGVVGRTCQKDKTL